MPELGLGGWVRVESARGLGSDGRLSVTVLILFAYLDSLNTFQDGFPKSPGLNMPGLGLGGGG